MHEDTIGRRPQTRRGAEDAAAIPVARDLPSRGLPTLLCVLVALCVPVWAHAIPHGPGPAPDTGTAGDPEPSSVPFLVEEVLLHPTHDGISFTAVPAVPASLFLEYGVAPGPLTHRTRTRWVGAGEAATFELSGLLPGTTYLYRMRCSETPGLRHGTRDVHSFKTLSHASEPFTFVYGTDSHYYELFANDTFTGTNSLETFHMSLDHMLEEDALFHILGGDWAQTSCKGCKGGTYQGEYHPPGSVTSIESATQRYLRTFAPDAYGRVTRSLPMNYMLGNHEGEAGFDQDELAYSLAARRAVFPRMPASYLPNDEESYYTFDNGDARFIFIDVMRYTLVKPLVASDWQLGPVQTDWLRRLLLANDKKWVFIVAEHLVGGEKAFGIGSNNMWYGRGGLRATDNNLPTGVFHGQQALVQALEEMHLPPGGAIFFLTGHDHVAIAPTEKPNPDGTGTRTYHLKGGRMGGVAFGWTLDSAFKKEMDWNLNGIADYDEPGVGTKKPGYFRIRVNGKESVVFDYIQSDKNDPASNGTVAFSRTIHAVDR